MKKGVLLVNLGTPDAPTYGAVYRYLKQFLLDPRVIDINPIARNLLVRGVIVPFRSNASAKSYRKLWTENGSPLKHYGELVTAGVQRLLGNEYTVRLAMRYQNPSIESVVQQLVRENISSLIVVPLFPQYASATTGSVHEEVMRVLSKEWIIPPTYFINSYHDLPAMIDIFVNNARELNVSQYDHVLMSFHGLPVRQLLKSDNCNHCAKTADCCQVLSQKNYYCYSAQCHATARLIAEKLGLSPDAYTVCFQSRLGREQWIEPYTSDVLEKRRALGDKKLLVFSPAFVADCLETTIEIGEEYHEEFLEKGGEKLDLVPSLNDNPKWIAALADLVKQAEGKTATLAAQQAML